MADNLDILYNKLSTGNIKVPSQEEFRKKYDIAPEEKILLFAGTLQYEPNEQAIESILLHLIPLLQNKKFAFRLFICGALPENKLTQLNSIPGVIAEGFVDSLQEYMASADVFINPVVSGSGIQTKNIEAIANGCNIVSTAFADNGLPAYLLGKKVFVSADNDWENFANNIITASSLQSAVPRQFYEDYNWQHIIDRLLRTVITEE